MYSVVTRSSFYWEFILYHSLLSATSYLAMPIPVFNELCRHSINFARSCVLHESKFISQIASYCICFARSKSPPGLNVLFCADRFQSNVDDILSGSPNHIVHSYFKNSVSEA
jgi:hypothetical protein